MSFSRPIVVVGAGGQLGSEIVRRASLQGLPVIALDHADVDVRDPASVERALRRSGPSIVVNCVAFHQVVRCEEDPSMAFSVNAVGAHAVASAARAIGARSVYVSTDYVFDGARPVAVDRQVGRESAYAEQDLPNPVNVYGASKLAGEALVRIVDPDALVIRTAGLFGRVGSREKGGNFIQAILARAAAGERIAVVNDRYTTPTYAFDAAIAIVGLVHLGVRGLVHVTNSGQCSWHELAVTVVDLANLRADVHAIDASERPEPVRRPWNSSLDTTLLASLIGGTQRHWRDAVAAYLRETQPAA